MDVKMFSCFWACAYRCLCLGLCEAGWWSAAYCTIITMSTGGGRALQKLWFSLFIINKMECFSLPISLSQRLPLITWYLFHHYSPHCCIYFLNLIGTQRFFVVVAFALAQLCSKVLQHSTLGRELNCLFAWLFVLIPEFELKWTIQARLILRKLNWNELKFM